MKIQFIETLTGSRVRPSEAAALIVTNGEGQLRINAAFARGLNVPYNEVNTDSKDEAGVRLDVGVVAKDGSKSIFGAYIMPLGSKKGAKLASPNKKTSGNLNANHGNVWARLGGEKGFITTYEVDFMTIGQGADGSFITVESAKEQGILNEDGEFTTMAVALGLAEADEVGQVAGLMAILKLASKVEFVPRKKGEGADEDGEEEDEDGEEFAGADFN